MAMPGFAGVNPTAVSRGYRPTGVPSGPGYKQDEITQGVGTAALGGGQTNRNAVQGALAYKNALGLPSFEDLLGKLGNGAGTKEFGNANLASTGADYLKGELENSKKGLAAQQANIQRARSGIVNPTKTAGFKNVMRLTNEREGNAAENDRRLAAEAASRRGFVGGYSGEANDQARRESLANAGYEAAGEERKAQQDLFGGEASLYGSELGQYGQQLGGYTDLTKSAAELPTKWLDSYSNLLGGLGNSYGDIFGTSSQNVRFDTGNELQEQGRKRQAANDFGARIRSGLSTGTA